MDEVLIRVSDPIIFDKKATVSVPMNHKGYLVINQAVVAQLKPCLEQNLKKLDKGLFREHKGESVKLILVVGDTSAMKGGWGFGTVTVNNRNMGELYSVGVNGYFTISINTPLALFEKFPGKSQITLYDVYLSIESVIKGVGTQMLAEYLSSIDKSKDDIATCTNEFASMLFDALKTNEGIGKLGISLTSLSVNDFFIP